MIVCPNCNHQNPDAATQCEECLTPLPATTSCPNCGAAVQTDAAFCGQCGYNLQAGSSAGGVEAEAAAEAAVPPTALSSPPVAATVAVPDIDQPEPLVQPDPLLAGAVFSPGGDPGVSAVPPDPVVSASVPDPGEPVASQQVSSPPPLPTPTPQPRASSTTQLQQQMARLLHVQTNTLIELPQNLSVIHIGKPNDMIPPDIDVSGFPNSEVVSRVHADIRGEGDAFYIEDVGSSNGTYINNLPLSRGNRHRLRPGDRIALGKGDMVTFLFQLS